MLEEVINSLTDKVIKLQDENCCWNVLDKNDKYYPKLNYYVPNYKSTLWTLIFLADIETNPKNKSLRKPLKIISDHFFDESLGIFSIGKSHFPIPCLNGNMIYLLSYFNTGDDEIINNVIDFFYKYQRFDDGNFKTPSSFPYHKNRSCYGSHTCFWGVVKLFKGLSFIPKIKRTKKCITLLNRCVDFILLHNVCYSSHYSKKYIHKSIKDLTFPNMYNSDFLEILWLLQRENIKSNKLERAIDLLLDKREHDGTWKIERRIKDLIIPIGRANYGNEFVSKRATEVFNYYSKFNNLQE